MGDISHAITPHTQENYRPRRQKRGLFSPQPLHHQKQSVICVTLSLKGRLKGRLSANETQDELMLLITELMNKPSL